MNGGVCTSAIATRRCNHPGCAGLASFGHGVALLKGLPGIWWCRAHRPVESSAAPPPVAPAQPQQGRLL